MPLPLMLATTARFFSAERERVEGGDFDQGADAASGQMGRRFAEPGKAPLILMNDPENHAQGRGLPAAVGSENAVDTPLLHCQIQAAHSLNLAKALGKGEGFENPHKAPGRAVSRQAIVHTLFVPHHSLCNAATQASQETGDGPSPRL
jgi:hypothetical protein